jgi:hypothetical protein
MAERMGFEPTKPFGLHTFQACAFSRSATSLLFCNCVVTCYWCITMSQGARRMRVTRHVVCLTSATAPALLYHPHPCGSLRGHHQKNIDDVQNRSRQLLLGNCSCITLLHTIHGGMRCSRSLFPTRPYRFHPWNRTYGFLP